MFQRVLKDVVDSTEGGVASLVMGLDGLTLDSYTKGTSAFDISIVGVEISVVVTQALHAARMLKAGAAQEVAIVADRLTTLVRMVNDDYFVAVSLEPGGNIGKARYLLRIRVPEMVQELS